MASNIERKEIENVYGKISPFEFQNKLINLAEGQRKKSAKILLNAGRGNPNWIAATPREAFFSFGQFAVEEARRTWNSDDLAGMPKKEGISSRIKAFIEKNSNIPGIELMKSIIWYGVTVKGFNPDDWIHELTDGIIGDNYPIPNRLLFHIEKVIQDYLIQELGYGEFTNNNFKVFGVEGATAAMCYIFDSLVANELLSPGDKVAVMTPIFTPYLEIPLLSRYDFDLVEIKASEITDDGTHTWQYPKTELEKLCDSNIKALFLVNPSNPPSVAIRPESVEQIKGIVKNFNTNLMIISDDVYGTFVNNFRSIISELPFNTIAVYSFSKYFGVTGWRLGTIALYNDNVFDKLLGQLTNAKKEALRKRYSALSTNPEEITFIDRIVADSRQVALNHTAGLSTPQQVQMAFFAIFSLVNNNHYKYLTQNICHERQKLLFEGLRLDLRRDPYDAAYYTEFDLLEWATYYYGNDFAKYLQDNYKPVDILYRLAEESSIVLLSGGGFHGPEWSVRISLANLDNHAYSQIGKLLHDILDGYVKAWEEST